MFIVGVDPLFVAGRGTFIDELITIAGGTNIAGESLSKYPQLGVEQVVAREPMVILYTSLNFELTPEQQVKAKELWSAYPSIPAVREDRICGGSYRRGPRQYDRDMHGHQDFRDL